MENFGANFKNNGKLKLLIIVGTRPEIIRLAAVINKARRYFDTILAHTGQNYDYNLNGVFFKDLQLDNPDVYLNAVGAGDHIGGLLARGAVATAAGHAHDGQGCHSDYQYLFHCVNKKTC